MMTSPETNPSPEPLTSTEPYRSGHALATLLFILLLAHAAADLLGIALAYSQFGMLREAAAAGGLSEEQADAKLTRDGIAGIITLLAFLASAVTFCFWIYRAHRNLRALGNSPSALEFSPGWAVGWFFIPLAHLIMPYRAVREVWVKSDPSVHTRDDLIYAIASTPALLPVWWGAWLVSNVLDNIHGRLYGESADPATILWASKFEIAVRAVSIGAAVLAALVVRGIDRRQEERSRHVTYAPPAPPSPLAYAPGRATLNS